VSNPAEPEPQSPDLADLLARVAEGDSAAAGSFYDRIAPRLYRRLRQRYTYLADEDVEDLLHDAFVLVLRNGGELLRRALGVGERRTLPQREAEQYVWNLACGLVSNRRRTLATRKLVPLSDWQETEGQQDGAERALVDRDALARLDACLRGGGARVYLYFKLRHDDGLSPEEIAQATGWSRKATYKLRQRLNEVVAQCAEKLGLRSRLG
jgi:RNA polymerase sigma factor (sigma-70 family)